MEDVDAIDTMCRILYTQPERAKPLFELKEAQTVAKGTFRGVMERHGIEEGEEWRVMEIMGAGSEEEMYREMDEVGVEKVFIDQTMNWFDSEARVHTVIDIDELGELAVGSDGRIVSGVGYNPFQIEESLERIERAVEEYGFKYVWFHPATYGLRPSDEKCYPLYTKCVDLDIPVCYQTGQSAEPLHSEPGHPMYAENVAIDFPSLSLVLTHTGWPWWEEWCSMLWRFPNVYGNIGAYFPSFLPERQVEFIDSRIRDKVMWATNGFGLTRSKQEFLELNLHEETVRQVLRENALKVFDI